MNNTNTVCWNVENMTMVSPTSKFSTLAFIDNPDLIIISSMLAGAFFPFIFWAIATIFSGNSSSALIPPLDIKDKYYDKQMRVMGNAKIKHRVILVRHGQSEHNKRHDGKDGEYQTYNKVGNSSARY